MTLAEWRILSYTYALLSCPVTEMEPFGIRDYRNGWCLKTKSVSGMEGKVLRFSYDRTRVEVSAFFGLGENE